MRTVTRDRRESRPSPLVLRDEPRAVSDGPLALRGALACVIRGWGRETRRADPPGSRSRQRCRRAIASWAVARKCLRQGRCRPGLVARASSRDRSASRRQSGVDHGSGSTVQYRSRPGSEGRCQGVAPPPTRISLISRSCAVPSVRSTRPFACLAHLWRVSAVHRSPWPTGPSPSTSNRRVRHLTWHRVTPSRTRARRRRQHAHAHPASPPCGPAPFRLDSIRSSSGSRSAPSDRS